VRRWYRALLQLRRERPELRALDKARVTTIVDEEAGGFAIIHAGTLAVAVSLRGQPVQLTLPDGPDGPDRKWRILHDAGDERFGHFAAARLDGNVISLPSLGAVIAIA
jgi:hypothetical protein